VLSLVLSIVGVMLCPVTAPFGWVIGRRAEIAVAAEPERYSGKDVATAGKIVGIIGTVLLSLYVLAAIVALIVVLATSGSSSSS
jgi:hypothetical protein